MFNATVVNRIDITPDLVRLFIKPDGGVPKFTSGQYVAIGLPGSAPRPSHFPPEETVPHRDKIIKRAYSIGSAPSEGVLEFYVAILPQGALTARLALVKPGDRIFAAAKITGTFTLEGVPDEANLVLISTGTGLAPYISMIRCPETWTSNRQITVVHGVRYPQDLGYRDELQTFLDAKPNFRYFPVVSRGGEDWKGEKGHVQRLFKEGVIPLLPEKDHVFLCGNPAMIEEMEVLLVGKGYAVHSKKTPGSLHLEKYW